MQQFTFRLSNELGGKVASAKLTLADEAVARARAAVHLSAAPYFRSIEIRREEEVICTVHRNQLDPLGRAFRQ